MTSGPDANAITKLVLERVALGIEFLEVRRERLPRLGGMATGLPKRKPGRRLRPHRTPAGPAWRVPVVRDKESNRILGPTLDRTELLGDCGVVIRCPNPFNERREVVIFCGSYGYGTMAAVRYAQSKEFLTSVPRRAKALECVLSVDIVAEAPQGIRMEILRPVDEPVRGPSAGIVVPRIVD